MKPSTPKFNDLLAIAVRVLRHAGRNHLTVSASSLAFHWFVTIVPGTIALIGVTNLIGLSHARLHAITHGISVLLPSPAAKVFDQALNSQSPRGSSLSAVFLGGIVAFWAGLESTATLQIAMDIAYETNADRGFLQRRARGLKLVGITIVLGGGAFSLLIVGEAIGSLIQPKGSAGWFPVLWTVTRWIVGVALVVVLISLYDYLAPSRSQAQWKLLSVGGTVSTILWLVVATGYSFYLNHFGHSSQTYGVFSGVVALQLWLFLTALAILLGAELNRELERSQSSGGLGGQQKRSMKATV